ncbi:MAG: iron uptake porin [Drouetiella hepatica Uher 2000/2452]|uniref:Iron uptake porin n=1 Tax=Drouetiella hepatica Uher 2000/2452 TaxID=904376 RepID=A0A951Q670_9CYAN|nr:iron uptake porin [Drouetiella hepatica Uher 2000/2452]
MSSKFFWKSLLATPALLGAAMFVSSSAIAVEVQPKAAADTLLSEASASSLELLSAQPLSSEAAPQLSAVPVQQATAPAVEAAAIETAPVQIAQSAPQQVAPATTSVSSLEQVAQYSSSGQAGSMSQVTSISQLSDVQPTDWAFQALQSLVERYGCIAGYPDGTYKGSRAMTRYEFAAGMNACLDRISELIASSTADLATAEDLATLQRLQEEFAAELATLRGRVDSLEARTAELEANQFSTTTKLKGETIFGIGIPLENGVEGTDEPQANLGYRIRLNLDTSFTGNDLLRARLQARDFGSQESLGGVAWKFGDGNPVGGSNTVILQKLFYTFPVGDRVQLTFAARGVSDSDFVRSTISPFDDDGGGALTSFGVPSQYNFMPGNAGAGAIVQLTDNLSLDFGYSASEAASTRPGAGLFNGDYGIVAQLTYLSSFVDAALTYGNGYNASGFIFDRSPEVANTYGGQVNFKFGALEVGGGVAYIPIRSIGIGDFDIWSYQGTLALRDLGGEGNLLGLLAGTPGYGSSIPGSLSGTFNQDNAFQVEGFYRFQVNDNISVTPGLIYITNPGNDDANGDSFVGAIRTTFSF